MLLLFLISKTCYILFSFKGKHIVLLAVLELKRVLCVCVCVRARARAREM
jgi:hypothetical protein